MSGELKDRILKYEEQECEPAKMTVAEIQAELQAMADTVLDDYIADSLRQKRLAETTTKTRKAS